MFEAIARWWCLRNHESLSWPFAGRRTCLRCHRVYRLGWR